jgi:hypothetical protein
MIVASIGTIDSVQNVSPTTTTTTFAPTTTTTTTAPSYYIGQSALGGTIAYILQPGDPGYDPAVQHGLVVGTVVQSIDWDYDFCNLNGDTSTAFGTGYQNTYNIYVASGCTPVGGNAVGLAWVTTQGGYSDWYLPSLDELAILYTTRVATGGWIVQNPNPDPLITNRYWASSAAPTDYSRYSYFYNFNGFASGQSLRTFQWNSRPVRSF